jgi:anti-sigma B factor antagonist
MGDPALRAEVVRQDDRVVVLSIGGEIDLATAPALAETLERVTPAPGGTVHLDVAEVSFLDSTGISVLVEARNRLEDHGASLVLHRVAPTVQRVLEISGLGTVFELRPDAPV